jgi:hypothetical protein
MDHLTIEEIAAKYRDFAIKHGNEFLFRVDVGLSLIEEFGQNDIMILGCILWKYVDQEKGWIVELLGAGFDIKEQQATAEQAARTLRHLILTQLPDDAELISLIFGARSVESVFDHIIST